MGGLEQLVLPAMGWMMASGSGGSEPPAPPVAAAAPTPIASPLPGLPSGAKRPALDSLTKYRSAMLTTSADRSAPTTISRQTLAG